MIDDSPSCTVEDRTDHVAVTDEEALELHRTGRPGKIEITPTKPLTTQRDLSLAYSPGVAAPCLAIRDDPNKVFDYTAKGNLVAVISNGTAVLGLGNLGALAAKPVMEGKSVLFKRFADIDAIDLEVDTEDVDAFVECVRLLGPTFGGINLEDIRAPGRFVIEQRLRECMDIPVFHDDQHGTAIIAAAGLINALDLTGRSLQEVKLVINGAGAASIACIELLKAMGLASENSILCDTKGVIYRGRAAGMNQWKSAHAVDTDARTLADALVGADAFFGLSAKGAMTQDMVKSMARQPIVFAMANPDPEIMPEAVKAVRPDAIIATGRSDYPNQVNNVLGFPYIFRGALDVRATTINDAMKIAAAYAIAALAREDVPDEVSAAYRGQRLRYGPHYLSDPFDPRLIVAVPSAVAQAAIGSGVARKPIVDQERYCDALRARLDPTASRMQMIIDRVRTPSAWCSPRARRRRPSAAWCCWRSNGLGVPILIGREERVRETMAGMGIAEPPEGLEIHNARLSRAQPPPTSSSCTGRNPAARLAAPRLPADGQPGPQHVRRLHGLHGDADAMVTVLTRSYTSLLRDVFTRVIDPQAGRASSSGCRSWCCAAAPCSSRTRRCTSCPTERIRRHRRSRPRTPRGRWGTPRVALLSFSNFGKPVRVSGPARAATPSSSWTGGTSTSNTTAR